MKTFVLFFLFVVSLQLSGQNINDSTYWSDIESEYYEIKSNKENVSDKELFNRYLNLYKSIDTLASHPVYLRISDKIASLYREVGSYEKAVEVLLRSLKSCGDNHRCLWQFQYTMSTVLYYSNNYDKALEYAQKAIQNIKKDSVVDFYWVSNQQDIIALIYFDQDIHDSAEFYFNIALKSLDKVADISQRYYLTKYDNLGQLYEYTDRPKQAVEKYKMSLDYYLKDSSYYDIAWNCNRLALLYSNKLKNREQALHYLEMGKRAANKTLHLDTQKDLYQTAITVYANYNVNDSLNESFEIYKHLNDSLINAKISDNIQEMETRYQVEKKEAALQMSLEKSSRLNTELENQRLWASVMLISLVVLAILTAFIFYYLRQKRKVAELELNIKERQLDELMQSQESKAYAAMLRGQDQERERIAQDLHDRLGGTLAALKMSLRRKENKVSEEDLEIVDEAVQEVRNIAHNLSSGLMQKYGLNQALQQLKNTVEKSGGLKFNVFLHPKISILGQGVAVELYRIVQELVNNTIKHAQATEVSLQTNFDGDVFNLIYEDNGKGFSPNEVKNGIGLENIKARVKRMNGTLHIDAEKGRGAIFIIELNRG